MGLAVRVMEIAFQQERAPAMSRQLVETLYSEALVLADEARMVFDISRSDGDDAETKVARSIEGLKTTTRVMHMLAWLLNQRAFYDGEISAKQLQMHGALPRNRDGDADQIALLDADARLIIEESERLHARIARIDEQQRRAKSDEPCGVHTMQAELMRAFA